jgi:hypothetical protein
MARLDIFTAPDAKPDSPANRGYDDYEADDLEHAQFDAFAV